MSGTNESLDSRWTPQTPQSAQTTRPNSSNTHDRVGDSTHGAGTHSLEGSNTALDRMRQNTAFGEVLPTNGSANRDARSASLQMQRASGAFSAQMVSFTVGDTTVTGAVAGNKLVTNTGDTYQIQTMASGKFKLDPVNRSGQSAEPILEATLSVKPNAFSAPRDTNQNIKDQVDGATSTKPTELVTTTKDQVQVTSGAKPTDLATTTIKDQVQVSTGAKPTDLATTITTTGTTGAQPCDGMNTTIRDTKAPGDKPAGKPADLVNFVIKNSANAGATDSKPGDVAAGLKDLSNTSSTMKPADGANGASVAVKPGDSANGPALVLKPGDGANGPALVLKPGDGANGTAVVIRPSDRTDALVSTNPNALKSNDAANALVTSLKSGESGAITQIAAHSNDVKSVLAGAMTQNCDGRNGGILQSANLPGTPAGALTNATGDTRADARGNAPGNAPGAIGVVLDGCKNNAKVVDAGVGPNNLATALGADRLKRDTACLDINASDNKHFIGEVIKQLTALQVSNNGSIDDRVPQLQQLVKGLDATKVEKLQDYLMRSDFGSKQQSVPEMISKLMIVSAAASAPANPAELTSKESASKIDAQTAAAMAINFGVRAAEANIFNGRTDLLKSSPELQSNAKVESFAPTTRHEPIKADLQGAPGSRPEPIKVDLQPVTQNKHEAIKTDLQTVAAAAATRPESVKVDLQAFPATRQETIKVDLQPVQATRSEIIRPDLEVPHSSRHTTVHTSFDPYSAAKSETVRTELTSSWTDYGHQNHLQNSELREHKNRALDEEKARREREERRLLAQEAKARQDAAFLAIAEQRRLNEQKARALKETEKLVEQEKKKNDDNKRRRYVVRQNDTLESIATTQLHNVNLTSLIHSINRLAIPCDTRDGKPIYVLRVGQAIWLPSNNEIKQALATIARQERIQKSHSAAADELDTKFGANWDGSQSTQPYSAAARFNNADAVTIKEKRRNIESFLGSLKSNVPLSDRIQYRVRLGDTLRSVALNHPALGDVALWKLLAQLNELSTDVTESGSTVAQLRRGTTLVIPSSTEILEYRRMTVSNRNAINTLMTSLNATA